MSAKGCWMRDLSPPYCCTDSWQEEHHVTVWRYLNFKSLLKFEVHTWPCLPLFKRPKHLCSAPPLSGEEHHKITQVWQVCQWAVAWLVDATCFMCCCLMSSTIFRQSHVPSYATCPRSMEGWAGQAIFFFESGSGRLGLSAWQMIRGQFDLMIAWCIWILNLNEFHWFFIDFSISFRLIRWNSWLLHSKQDLLSGKLATVSHSGSSAELWHTPMNTSSNDGALWGCPSEILKFSHACSWYVPVSPKGGRIVREYGIYARKMSTHDK